jgi:hypothetical protein
MRRTLGSPTLSRSCCPGLFMAISDHVQDAPSALGAASPPLGCNPIRIGIPECPVASGRNARGHPEPASPVCLPGLSRSPRTTSRPSGSRGDRVAEGKGKRTREAEGSLPALFILFTLSLSNGSRAEGRGLAGSKGRGRQHHRTHFGIPMQSGSCGVDAISSRRRAAARMMQAAPPRPTNKSGSPPSTMTPGRVG